MSEFDPAETIADGDEDDDSAELPYEGLFDDAEDCGPKVLEGVAKRINSACTKEPAKEQKKYFCPENCEFLKAPGVNPELWDRLIGQDKKS